MFSVERDKPRKPSRFLAPIDTCLICENSIMPLDTYSFFVDGYAHDACIAFLRLQARLARSD